MWYVLDLIVRRFPGDICLFQLYFYTQETSPKQLADIKVQSNRKHWLSQVISTGRNICGLYSVNPKPTFVPLCPLLCFIFHIPCCLITVVTFLKAKLILFSPFWSILAECRRYFIKLSQQPASHPSHPFPIFPATQNCQVFSKHYILCFFLLCSSKEIGLNFGPHHDMCTLTLPLSWFMLFDTSMFSYYTPLFEVTVFFEAKMAFFFKTQLSISCLVVILPTDCIFLCLLPYTWLVVLLVTVHIIL